MLESLRSTDAQAPILEILQLGSPSREAARLKSRHRLLRDYVQSLLAAPTPDQTEELTQAIANSPDCPTLALWICAWIEGGSEKKAKSTSTPGPREPSHGPGIRELYLQMLYLAGYETLAIQFGLETKPSRNARADSHLPMRHTLIAHLLQIAQHRALGYPELAALRLIAPSEAACLTPNRGEVLLTEDRNSAPFAALSIDLARNELTIPPTNSVQYGVPLEWRLLAYVILLSAVMPRISRALLIDLLWNEKAPRIHLEMRFQKLLERLRTTHQIPIRAESSRSPCSDAPSVVLDPAFISRTAVRITGRVEKPSLLEQKSDARSGDVRTYYGVSRSHSLRIYNRFIEEGWTQRS